MHLAVTREDLEFKPHGRPLQLLGGLIVYTVAPALFLLHGAMIFVRQTAFRIFGIPRVPFSDYLLLDRAQLRKLNLVQRVGCVYCEYANALIAWTKANINILEAYSCAIKHSAHRKGQEHQDTFYPYGKFR